jgi:hypothetical protein
MRKFLLFALITSIGMISFAQERAVAPKEYRNICIKKSDITKGAATPSDYIPGVKFKSILSDQIIGNTWYDIQTNQSMQTRIYMHSDGTIGAVWTRGPESNPGGNDRGTGYNFNDASSWGPNPTSSLEWSGARAGWPAYTTWGENGEAYVCHDYLEGTILGTRVERGMGNWTQVIQAGPPGIEDISFPRIATTGPDRNTIHILSTTWVPYNGQEHALFYARTTDAGTTWEVENQTIDYLGLDYTLDLSGDTYDWAEPKDNLLAFLVGDSWMDLVLMKSYDNGESWDETVIWECPYPLNPIGNPTDTFYCPDGAHHLAIDEQGLVHVVFGLTRAIDDGEGQGYYPAVDGVVYWNENRPTFSDDINALNPYDDATYTELEEDYSLIGWSQDVDGDGELEIVWDGVNATAYNTGLSSHPQMVVDEQNRIFVLYSSVTENYEYGAGESTFRHIWVRSSPNGGDWWGSFYDMNSDLIYILSECAYPSISPTSNDSIYFIFQEDNVPGPSEDGISPDENRIRFMSVLKDNVISGIKERTNFAKDFTISQNVPNPADDYTRIYLNLDKTISLKLELRNLLGQIVYKIDYKDYVKGINKINIRTSMLKPGVYNYIISDGKNSISKKMIVR